MATAVCKYLTERWESGGRTEPRKTWSHQQTLAVGIRKGNIDGHLLMEEFCLAGQGWRPSEVHTIYSINTGFKNVEPLKNRTKEQTKQK